MPFPPRKHPAHGVLIRPDAPVIVFLTVCTHRRSPWLASETVHSHLVEAWTQAGAWAVGRYVVMPDHVHLFAAPRTAESTLDAWVTFWKRAFTRLHGVPGHRWQADHWDTRLRHEDSYGAKWAYVRNNPVRARLVAAVDEWPHQGELQRLTWHS